MNEEFYIGQIFEGSYPPAAAIACNQNGWFIDVIGERRYEIKAVPPAPAPTREDVEKARIAYRHEHIDDETLCRLRKQANGTWTQEMEDEYLALDAEVTAYIEEHLPYPTDPITEEEEDAGSQD